MVSKHKVIARCSFRAHVAWLNTFLQKLALTRAENRSHPPAIRRSICGIFRRRLTRSNSSPLTACSILLASRTGKVELGKRYIDRINLELTAAGVAQFTSHNPSSSNDEAAESVSPFAEKLAELKQDFEGKILSPLRSDLRVQGLSAFALGELTFWSFWRNINRRKWSGSKN